MEAVVPGKWSIYLKRGRSQLNIVFLGVNCHWAALDVLGGCPSGVSTPSVLWKLPGLQDSQGQKGRVIAKHESL